MRMTRQPGGPIHRRVDVENAHRDLTGQDKPFWLIAAELYDRCGSQALVQQEIQRLYNVTVSEKTASLWINRGLEERRKELGGADDGTPRPVQAAA